MQKNTQTVKTLLDSIPFIKEFAGKIVVIKYGGSAQINPELKAKFARDILLLTLVGIKPVIVHGGGKRINELLDALKIESEFVGGHRVTNKEAMGVVEMVLSGEINSEIVSLLNHHGAKAIGLSGKDGKFMTAIPKDGGALGYTGDVTKVDGAFLSNLLSDGFVPVIAPVADSDEMGHPGFNINADVVACEVAKSLKAEKLLFLTDIAGVFDGDKNLIQTLTKSKVAKLIEEGVINGGMIPKCEACIDVIDGGVRKAHIVDGRVEHSILLEIFTTDGVGTQFLAG